MELEEEEDEEEEKKEEVDPQQQDDEELRRQREEAERLKQEILENAKQKVKTRKHVDEPQDEHHSDEGEGEGQHHD